MGAAPASWKTKCTIRKVDAQGRLIDLEPRPSDHLVTSTLRMSAAPPSIAPVSYEVFPIAPWDDLEERLPPARNGDAVGVGSTQPIRLGWDGSFWAGVVSGFLALTAGAGFAYAAAVSDVPDLPRERRAVVHRASTLEIAGRDDAFEKAGAVVTPEMLPDAR